MGHFDDVFQLSIYNLRFFILEIEENWKERRKKKRRKWRSVVMFARKKKPLFFAPPTKRPSVPPVTATSTAPTSSPRNTTVSLSSNPPPPLPIHCRCAISARSGERFCSVAKTEQSSVENATFQFTSPTIEPRSTPGFFSPAWRSRRRRWLLLLPHPPSQAAAKKLKAKLGCSRDARGRGLKWRN